MFITVYCKFKMINAIQACGDDFAEKKEVVFRTKLRKDCRLFFLLF